MEIPIPTQESHNEAKKYPGGWVYAIDPKYKGQEEVPPEGIVGAWQVDNNGNLTDRFEFNSNYKASQEPNSKKAWWRF